MPQIFRFEVNADSSGQRLDEFLAARLGSLSRMRIVVLADRGACAVNGVACPPGHKLAAGDHIELADEEDKPTAMTPEKIPLEILHEDDQLLVVVKPAGLLVHPTHSDMTGTLANALAYHLNRLRIDETDGDEGARGRGGGVRRRNFFLRCLFVPPSPRLSIDPPRHRPSPRPRHLRPARRRQDATRFERPLTTLSAPPRREALPRAVARPRRRRRAAHQRAHRTRPRATS